MRKSSLAVWAFGLACAIVAPAKAALVVNGPQPIAERINVRVIGVADNAGANAAPLWGTPAQQALVFSMVDQIWAQAGIDVDFTFRAGTYDNTFAHTGTPGSNNPRSTGDLNTIITAAAAASGVLSTDPNTLNLFMVRIVPGFSQTSDNTSNGLAFLGGNGITYWAGPNLPGFTGGQEVLAAVLAHEIGHNMGLDHIAESQNLMQEGGSANPGQRLNSAQIATSLASSFSVPVPEPTAGALIALAGVFTARRRRAA